MEYVWNAEGVREFLQDSISGCVFSQFADFFAIKDRSGKIHAAAAYDDETKRGVDVYCAIADNSRITPRFLFTAFAVPFMKWKKERLGAKVSADNLKSRRFLEHLGFKYEGTEREAAPDGQNLLIYGMLKRECRFIVQERPILPQPKISDNSDLSGIYAALLLIMENKERNSLLSALNDFADTLLLAQISAGAKRGIARSKVIERFKTKWRSIAAASIVMGEEFPEGMIEPYLREAFKAKDMPNFFRNYKMEKAIFGNSEQERE